MIHQPREWLTLLTIAIALLGFCSTDADEIYLSFAKLSDASLSSLRRPDHCLAELSDKDYLIVGQFGLYSV